VLCIFWFEVIPAFCLVVIREDFLERTCTSNDTRLSKLCLTRKHGFSSSLVSPCKLSIGSVSNFSALIVKGFGSSKLVTTLLQIPYGFIILFAVLSAMYIQRWLPGQRRCVVTVPACPSTNPVEQPIDLFFNRPTHTTLLHAGIEAWPIAPLASSLFNRPQGENYAYSVAKWP
jgi:hypothetical protein